MSDIDEIRKRHEKANKTWGADFNKDRATLLAKVEALQARVNKVKLLIVDYRDGFYPDRPPYDFNQFMREVEELLK